MVQTVTELDEPPNAPEAFRWSTRISVVLALGVGIVLGYLGWVLPSPGGSLLVPTLIVLGIGVVLAGCSWILACFYPRRRDLWIFAVIVGGLTLLASLWTFWFSLPAAMWLDTGATHQAQSALVKLSHEPKNANGVPINNCWTVETGKIGPLRAPYRECAISNSVGGSPFVDLSFVPLASPQHSIQFTNFGTGAFFDLCYRHLIGSWWMTTWGHSGISDCPIGYQLAPKASEDGG